MVEIHGSISRLLLSAVVTLATAIALCMAGCAPFPATVNSQATTTPRMVSANLAVLGGSPDAFTHRFGPPDHLPAFYAFTTPHGDRILITLGTLHNLVTGSIRVRMITLEPDDNKMWDAATAKTLYQSFFPPDAVFAHNGTGANGIYQFYTSTLLANTFPAQAFLNNSGKRLPPGTFEVVCNNKIMPSEGDANGCGLAIGEWPHF